MMSSADYLSSELALAEAVEKCSDINDMVVICGKQLSQLMVACYHGSPDCVQALLEVPGIKIELQNDKGRHALACACMKGHTKVIQLLLNAYPNPQQLVNLTCPGLQGVSCLILASQSGHTESVSLLIQNGALVNAQGYRMVGFDHSKSKWPQ